MDRPAVTLTIELSEEQVAALAAHAPVARESEWPMYMSPQTTARYTGKPISTLRKSTLRKYQPEGKNTRISYYRPEVDAWMRGEPVATESGDTLVPANR